MTDPRKVIARIEGMLFTERVSLATYNIQVFGPSSSARDIDGPAEQDKRVLSNLPAMLEAVEEDLTKLLPPGYSAVIREWSSDE